MELQQKDQGNSNKEVAEGEVKLKEGSYRVQVEIHECRDLQPRIGLVQTANPFGDKAGSASPTVEVELLSQKQLTKVLQKTLNPIFQETLFFNLDKKKVEELESAQFQFKRNNIIGAFTIDFLTVYSAPFHEIYRIWGALIDITDEVEGIQGYIKFSVQILGEGDEQRVHDRAREKAEQEKNAKGDMFACMMPPSIQQKGYEITLRLHRAEHLAPMDLLSNSCDPYVIMQYGGSSIKSNVISKNRNPVFNQKLIIGTAIPNQAGKILIEVMDRNLDGSDIRIGTVRIPFKDLQDEKKSKTLNTAK